MTDATNGKKLIWQSQPDAPMPTAFAKLCQLDPMLKSVWEEANHPRYRRDPNFCRSQLWGATPQSSGKFGLKVLLAQRVGSGAAVEALRTGEAWEIACAAIRKAIPPCNHEPGAYHKDGDTEWQDDTCTHQYPLEISQKVRDGNAISTDRNAKKGLKSLTAMLEESAGGEPATELDLAHTPSDVLEPIFIVPSYALASALYRDFEFEKRLKAGQITHWYHNNAFYVCDEDTRQLLLQSNLTRENITGPLAWKPVVLTFKDEVLEELFTSACSSAAVVDLHSKYVGSHPVTLEQFRADYKPVAMAEEVGIKDMPADVLDGELGEICRKHMPGLPIAYAWPSLLLAASVFIQTRGNLRSNLFVSMVGPVHTGKSSAMELAAKLLGITNTEWKNLQAGSFEGLSQDDTLSKVNGANRLVWIDELVHLLKKTGIENSTFASNLNTLFYNDEWTFIIAHGKKIEWNCRLSIGGGLPDDAFGDLFGKTTIGGLYDRFLFSYCPTAYTGYKYKPLDNIQPLRRVLRQSPNAYDGDNGGNEFDSAESIGVEPKAASKIEVDASVWRERDRWIDILKVSPRCAEIGLRAAFICAAFDGRTTLRGSDLEPALALAQYQTRIRVLLAPNPGKDDIAVLQSKLMLYLYTRAQNGELVNRRVAYQSIRAYDYDLAKVKKAIANLVANGDIAEVKLGRQWCIKLLAVKPVGAAA
jgi:hypothetical protein